MSKKMYFYPVTGSYYSFTAVSDEECERVVDEFKHGEPIAMLINEGKGASHEYTCHMNPEQLIRIEVYEDLDSASTDV